MCSYLFFMSEQMKIWGEKRKKKKGSFHLCPGYFPFSHYNVKFSKVSAKSLIKRFRFYLSVKKLTFSFSLVLLVHFFLGEQRKRILKKNKQTKKNIIPSFRECSTTCCLFLMHLQSMCFVRRCQGAQVKKGKQT